MCQRAGPATTMHARAPMCRGLGLDFPANHAPGWAKATDSHVRHDYPVRQPSPRRIANRSKAPAGTGLGSSPMCVAAILRALVELPSLPLGG